MAAIASNLMFSGTPTSTTAAGSANGVGAESGASGATDPSGTFMQLVTGMIQGNTPGEQLPSNLAAFLLTGDSTMLEGLETDTTDLDDEEIGEDELLALSALLPGTSPCGWSTAAPMMKNARVENV